MCLEFSRVIWTGDVNLRVVGMLLLLLLSHFSHVQLYATP